MKKFLNYRIHVFRLILFGFVLHSCSHADAQKNGSWGDQGDGTYKNPILNADYPDIDIEQVGDTYYMISSKQQMSPGMVILTSKDMVNWTSIGHVWDKLDWAPEYNWDKMSGYQFGTWAGDLVFHNQLWYCYMIDFNHGLYVSTAKNIHGPWTKAEKMLDVKDVFDDPAVFFDDETQEAYLICNTGEKQKTKKNTQPGFENRLYKLSWDGKKVLDEGTVIYTGEGAEAAKIYKVDGVWYIFLSEWYRPDPRKPDNPDASSGDRKQIVLRSKTNSIYGPYGKKVVLERGNGIIRSASQGGLMKAPDGSWWYMHQLIQNIKAPFQGRPQCLEPVRWVDGWPVIGVDVDNDGIGEPVLSYKKPIDGFPVNAPKTDDDFDNIELGAQWEWNHNPRDAFWSLSDRKGWLRLKAGMPVQKKEAYKHHEGAVFWRAYNTLSQRLMGTTTGVADAKFDLSGMKPGQKAGFVRFGGVCHLLGVKMDESEEKYVFFMDNKGKEKTGGRIVSNDFYVRTSNNGNKAFYEYSVDGKTYKKFGDTFEIKFGKWTGDRLGFFTLNEEKEQGYIDIDWFKYEYDGPKAKD